MKVLIVCAGNAPGGEDFIPEVHQAFIVEQAEAVKKSYPVEYDFFFIKGRGLRGYVKNFLKLKSLLAKTKYDLVHAHYGLSGVMANFQRKVPVVTTYHGSDINRPWLRKLSYLSIFFSSFNIFVSEEQVSKLLCKGHYGIVPCGVNLDMFFPVEKEKARKQLGFGTDEVLVLFSSSFANPVKNYPLAAAAVKKIERARLIELKGYSRAEVNLLLNAADVALLTSFSEGSPQFVKEAMACNCPVVSTPVGDVREIIAGTEGCFLCTFDAEDVARKIRQALVFGKRTHGREKISRFDNREIAKKIYDIYCRVIEKTKK